MDPLICIYDKELIQIKEISHKEGISPYIDWMSTLREDGDFSNLNGYGFLAIASVDS